MDKHLIDRDILFNSIDKDTVTDWYTARWMVLDQPVVDPFPTGEWSEVYDESGNPLFRRKFYCSACGDWNTYGKTKHCPYCGAKMTNTTSEKA